MQTPLEGLRHWEQIAGQRVWLRQPLADGQVLEYTWADAAAQARRMASYLKSLGLPPRSQIAILGKNSAHWIIADLAIWMAGHVTVPLYPTLDVATARYILEHSQTRFVFIGRLDALDLVPADLPKVALPLAPILDIPRWDEVLARHAPLDDFAHRAPEEPATIVYTSGTTGNPKGVVHSFSSLCAPVRTARDVWRLSSEDRLLSYLPLAHIGERVAVEIAALLLGCHVYFSDRLETFPADLRRARPTWFFSVPRLWTRFYQAIQAAAPEDRRQVLAQLGLDQVRIATTAAAPMAPEMMAAYQQVGLELLEVFGMTENAATSHACRPGQQRLGYVGKPLPGVECRISSEGEILVKSPGQMLGYYKEPEFTAQQLTADGFFRTGDLGEIDSEGWLRVTGRIKELFKTSKGKYVAPVPIENRLVSDRNIEAACVMGHGLPEAFAVVLLSPAARREGLDQELEALLDRVNGVVSEAERLRFIVIATGPWTSENGVLTPTLKIRRSVLEGLYLPRAVQWRASERRVIRE